MTIDPLLARRKRAARRLGLGWLLGSGLLACLLIAMPLPSHVPVVLIGIVVLAASACTILAYGLHRWSGMAVLSVVAAASTLGAMTVRSANEALAQVPLEIDASDGRCWISIRGDLDTGLYRRLRGALDEHPRSRALLLKSAGGSALSLGRVATLLQERGVDTAVAYEQCDSACAFLWASARRRILAATARPFGVGFHAPHFIVPGIGPVRAAIQDQSQRRHLLATGLPPPFVDWAYASVDGIWRPDARQLNRLGVQTEVVKTAHPETLGFCGKPVQPAAPST